MCCCASSGRFRPWTRLAGRRCACRAPHCDLIRLPFAGKCARSRAGQSAHIRTHTHARGALGRTIPPRTQGARPRRSRRPCLHAYLQTLFARFPAQVIDISMGRRYFLFIAGWLGAEHSVFPVRVRGASGGCHAPPAHDWPPFLLRANSSAHALT